MFSFGYTPNGRKYFFLIFLLSKDNKLLQKSILKFTSKKLSSNSIYYIFISAHLFSFTLWNTLQEKKKKMIKMSCFVSF